MAHARRAWHVTASMWQICVLPVRNSPYISVMEPDSTPPARQRRRQQASGESAP